MLGSLYWPRHLLDLSAAVTQTHKCTKFSSISSPISSRSTYRYSSSLIHLSLQCSFLNFLLQTSMASPFVLPLLTPALFYSSQERADNSSSSFSGHLPSRSLDLPSTSAFPKEPDHLSSYSVILLMKRKPKEKHSVCLGGCVCVWLNAIKRKPARKPAAIHASTTIHTYTLFCVLQGV